jgi:anti-anti-sigma factor
MSTEQVLGSVPVPPSLFALSVSSVKGATVLAVSGEVDLATAPGLMRALDEALDDEPAVLVVDLTSVRFFGSAALRVVAMAHQRAIPGGLAVVAPTRVVRRVFQLAGMDKVLGIHATVADALGAVH